MEVAQAFQPRLEEYECVICKDLVFKPAVNVCQHVFCFWCLHQSMNNVSESNCPLCRREYGHLARTCGLLHFFLGSAFPAEYRARQAEVIADEERHEIAAEDIEADPVLLDTPPSIPGAHTQTRSQTETQIQNQILDGTQTQIQTQTQTQTQLPNQTLDHTQTQILDQVAAHSEIHRTLETPSLDGSFTSYSPTHAPIEAVNDETPRSKQRPISTHRPYPFAGPGTKYAFRGVDFGCRLCQRLLHEPTVLVCGHVFCLPCIRTRAADPRCPLCRIMQSDDPRSMAPCASIADLVSKAFPDESAVRAREVAAEAAMKTAEAAQVPSPERPPTVQEAMSRARTLLLSAHADLVRRGDPFHLRAMTDRLLLELDPKFVVHFGVGCDGCGQSPIVGDRFQCTDCQERLGFDMCGHCHDMETPVRGLFDQRHTREHRVTQIPPIAAFTTRHFGIDPYRVLFTNPELPYQSVQRMRDEMQEEGELEFFLSELEEAETPGSPESGPSEDANASWPDPFEHDPHTRTNHVDFYPSPAVFPSFFENLAPDGFGARQAPRRSHTSSGNLIGPSGPSQTRSALDPDAPVDWGPERLAPGERSPVGGRIWAHRVGGDRGRGPPGGVAPRGVAVAGRAGPNAGAPGLGQLRDLRRADSDWFARDWVEAMRLPEEPDSPAANRVSNPAVARVRVRTREVHASHSEAANNGNGLESGNGHEPVRGEWHDVHEGGVEGQERMRPATAFGQRRLRRSFGRRHILPYRLPYPEDTPDTRRTFGNAERTGDSGPEITRAAATVQQEEPASSVEANETLGMDTDMGITEADQFPDSPGGSSEDADEVAANEVEPLVRTRSMRDSEHNSGNSSRRNGRGVQEAGYSPRGPLRARRSMDGLPPLPPRRRSLSTSPLERRAGLLMLTLASTAAEHPSFENAGQSSAERNREVRYRLLERHAAQATTGDAFPGESHRPLFGEVFAAASESADQQLLADYATQFDSERTVQDMRTDDPPDDPPAGGAAERPFPESAVVTQSSADVTPENGGPETAGEAPPQIAMEPVNQAVVNQAGLVSEEGVSGATAGVSTRQGYSLVDTLVRALGGQRRRPRDGQPEAPEASPSQVRRLRRPEE